MPSNTVNWSSADTWQRLVAAIVATGVKVDLHEVAKHYGTTYDTVQNRYRKIRKDADELKKEVASGERGECATPKKAGKSASPTPASRKAKATRDALNAVTSGRVGKVTPSKKKAVVKTETIEHGAADDPDDIFHGVDFGADSGDVGIDREDSMFE